MCAHRIQVDVARQLAQISVSIAPYALAASPEQALRVKV